MKKLLEIQAPGHGWAATAEAVADKEARHAAMLQMYWLGGPLALVDNAEMYHNLKAVEQDTAMRVGLQQMAPVFPDAAGSRFHWSAHAAQMIAAEIQPDLLMVDEELPVVVGNIVEIPLSPPNESVVSYTGGVCAAYVEDMGAE